MEGPNPSIRYDLLGTLGLNINIDINIRVVNRRLVVKNGYTEKTRAMACDEIGPICAQNNNKSFK